MQAWLWASPNASVQEKQTSKDKIQFTKQDLYPCRLGFGPTEVTWAAECSPSALSGAGQAGSSWSLPLLLPSLGAELPSQANAEHSTLVQVR